MVGLSDGQTGRRIDGRIEIQQKAGFYVSNERNTGKNTKPSIRIKGQTNLFEVFSARRSCLDQTLTMATNKYSVNSVNILCHSMP